MDSPAERLGRRAERRDSGVAELGGQEFQDPLVNVGRTLHHQEVPDTLDQLGLRSRAAEVRYPVYLFLGHAVAAVLGAVQVQRGLGDVLAPGRRLLSRPFLRAEPVGVELPPVVAQRGLEMRRITDALLDL